MDLKKVQELYNLNLEQFPQKIRDNLKINNKQTRIIKIINNQVKIYSYNNQIISIKIMGIMAIYNKITNKKSIIKEQYLHKIRCIQEDKVLICLTQNKNLH